MKHIVRVGTDVASLGFFDPAALPDDVDQQLARDVIATQSALVDAGRFAWINSESDGGYLMHFYVDEPVPDRIAAVAQLLEELPRLHVPSGVLWAAGAEYLAKDPAVGRAAQNGLRKRSHMGASFQVPAGDYAATVWNLEWPEGAEEQSIAQALGAAAARRRERLSTALGWLIGATIILSLILLGSCYRDLDKTDPLPDWHAWAWPGLGAAFIVLFLIAQLLRPLDRRAREIERDFPSYVAHLRRL